MRIATIVLERLCREKEGGCCLVLSSSTEDADLLTQRPVVQSAPIKIQIVRNAED